MCFRLYFLAVSFASLRLPPFGFFGFNLLLEMTCCPRAGCDRRHVRGFNCAVRVARRHHAEGRRAGAHPLPCSALSLCLCLSFVRVQRCLSVSVSVSLSVSVSVSHPLYLSVSLFLVGRAISNSVVRQWWRSFRRAPSFSTTICTRTRSTSSKRTCTWAHRSLRRQRSRLHSHARIDWLISDGGSRPEFGENNLPHVSDLIGRFTAFRMPILIDRARGNSSFRRHLYESADPKSLNEPIYTMVVKLAPFRR